MPKVGKKEFPYTKAGMKAAAAAKKAGMVKKMAAGKTASMEKKVMMVKKMAAKKKMK